jgi:hypothetical protein
MTADIWFVFYMVRLVARDPLHKQFSISDILLFMKTPDDGQNDRNM